MDKGLGKPVMSGLRQRLLRLNMTKNQTKNGKISKFSAIVAVGNCNGGLGIGSAKHQQATDAIQKAAKIAVKNMEYFPLYRSRTLYHDDFVKFKATKLYVRPASEESGLRCHHSIAEISSCLGIRDISAKVHGSSHPATVAQAFLKVLRRQKTPNDVSKETGLQVVDVMKLYNSI
jgi:small subunit ribosomal protein S5